MIFLPKYTENLLFSPIIFTFSFLLNHIFSTITQNSAPCRKILSSFDTRSDFIGHFLSYFLNKNHNFLCIPAIKICSRPPPPVVATLKIAVYFFHVFLYLFSRSLIILSSPRDPASLDILFQINIWLTQALMAEMETILCRGDIRRRPNNNKATNYYYFGV